MIARDVQTSVEPARGRLSKAEIQRRAEEAEYARSKKARLLQEMAMEVAADDEQPFPAPFPKMKDFWASKQK